MKRYRLIEDPDGQLTEGLLMYAIFLLDEHGKGLSSDLRLALLEVNEPILEDAS